MNHETVAETLDAMAADVQPEDMARMIEDGTLDDHYQAISAGARWLERVAAIHPDSRAFLETAGRLSSHKHEVLEFFHRYFTTRSVIGHLGATEAPDYVFILAHRDDRVMAMRVDGAVPLLRDHPDAVVVLCGGGFDPRSTEAHKMQRQLLARGFVHTRTIVEDDSVDTVGNAVFSKLRLLQEGLPIDAGRAVVVTSEFHAVRALSIFRRVYGPAFVLGAVPVDTESRPERERVLAAHELETDYRSSTEIFGMWDPRDNRVAPVDPADERTLFFQLLLHHDLYRHRYDLARKFAGVLGGRAAE
jgi:hypothetical protein